MFLNCCCCSVVKSCLALCDPINCGMPSFFVLHYLPGFAQIHAHWIGDAIQLYHLLSSHSPLPSVFLSLSLSTMSQLCPSDTQSFGASFSASVLPMNIQGWFPLELTGLLSLLSKVLSSIFSSITIWKHQFFGAQFSLWSNSHILHDNWKNHTLIIWTFVSNVMSLHLICSVALP